MPKFGQRIAVAVEALSNNPRKEIDENDFIDASRLVYDGVREIRRAVLMSRVSVFIIQCGHFVPVLRNIPKISKFLAF